MLSEESRKAADRLRDVGYLKQYSGMLRRMNVAFWWSGIKDGQREILNNGTICYVDTGSAKLGITADHVYAKYLEEKEQVEDVEMQLGGNTINIEDFLIDRDGTLDIATFRIPEPFVGASEAYYHTSLTWPVRRIEKAEVIIHGGYPQVLRDRKTGEVDFGFQYFASAVNDATEDAITIYPPEDAYWPEKPGATLPRSFGGQSGGPVYRVVDANLKAGGSEVVDRVELVGFIYLEAYERVFARHSDLVNVDGTLRRPGSVTSDTARSA